MSAYVIVEATVLDAESRNRYASQVEPLFREFGAEVIAFGPWQVLSGEPAFDNGMIIRFPDNESALAWYQSPAYQASWKSAVPPSIAVSALSMNVGGRKTLTRESLLKVAETR
jgi:uncharacterized protein (DUF1330 family)